MVQLLTTEIFLINYYPKIIQINRLIFVDHKNCRIQLLVVVIIRKLNQNRKSDDDDAVHKLCSQRYKVQTVKLAL